MSKVKIEISNNLWKETNLDFNNEFNGKNSDNHENNNNSDDCSQEYITKNYIDLSFLEYINNEKEENNSFFNNINNNNLNNNMNKISELNETNLINNIFQNNNYYQQYFNNNYLLYSLHLQQINNILSSNQSFNNNNNNNLKRKTIDKRYLINIMDIKTNKEKRTTIRMMNIPSYFRPCDLVRKIDEKFGITPQKENRIYDFIYIPFRETEKNKEIKNSGYAFINFVHPKHIIKFYLYFNGKHLKLKTSKKICIITFATKQGIYIKNKSDESKNNDNYMYFTDTKNHMQLLNE